MNCFPLILINLEVRDCFRWLSHSEESYLSALLSSLCWLLSSRLLPQGCSRAASVPFTVCWLQERKKGGRAVHFYQENKSFLSPRSTLKSYWWELGHMATLCCKEGWEMGVRIMIDLASGTGL